jgi:hypothetical protein
MYPKYHIDVSDFFSSSSLHTREQAQQLFKKIEKLINSAEEFFVDFSDIEFVSRSFADELIYLRSHSPHKEFIQFCCLEPVVDQMFSAVTRTQQSRALHHQIPVHEFSSIDEVMNYFSN